MLLENDIVDLDDVKFVGLGGDATDESTTRLSSPDSSRQSVSQDSGVVSDIDVKELEPSTLISSVPTRIDIDRKTNWNPPRYSRHNSMNYGGRHSSISGGDTFSSRSGSRGSSDDSDSTDAGSDPSIASYPDSPVSIRSMSSSIQNGIDR